MGVNVVDIAAPYDLDRFSSNIIFWKRGDHKIWKPESHWHGLGQLFSLDGGSAATGVGNVSWLLATGRIGWISLASAIRRSRMETSVESRYICLLSNAFFFLSGR
jgi:hypothetical protein